MSAPLRDLLLHLRLNFQLMLAPVFLWGALAADGHAVRCLISYGSQWFPWYMRRLAERPANVWFVMRTALTR